MKILHVSRSPCANAIHSLSCAINDYTEHESVWAGLTGTVGHLTFPDPDFHLTHTRFLWELCDADVVILHNYIGTDSQPIDDILAARPDLRVAAFYHSHPDNVNLQPVQDGFPAFCPAQFQALLFEGAIPVMQTIRYERADWPRAVAPEDRSSDPSLLRVGFAPSVRHDQKGPKPSAGWYDSKGMAPTLLILEQFEEAHPDEVELIVIEGVRYDAAMRLKAECDLLIDEVVTGSYHRSTLEAMGLGIPVIVNVDADVWGVVNRVTGCQPDFMPWLQSDLDGLRDTLESCLRNRADLKALGGDGFKWLEKYAHPCDVARTFTKHCERLPTVAEVRARMETDRHAARSP